MKFSKATDMQKLQLQIPRHFGHIQLFDFAISSAFSPYLTIIKK